MCGTRTRRQAELESLPEHAFFFSLVSGESSLGFTAEDPRLLGPGVSLPIVRPANGECSEGLRIRSWTGKVKKEYIKVFVSGQRAACAVKSCDREAKSYKGGTAIPALIHWVVALGAP